MYNSALDVAVIPMSDSLEGFSYILLQQCNVITFVTASADLYFVDICRELYKCVAAVC